MILSTPQDVIEFRQRMRQAAIDFGDDHQEVEANAPLMKFLAEGIADSTLFFVGEEVVDLIDMAAPTVPDDTRLEHVDIPRDTFVGLAKSSRPIKEIADGAPGNAGDLSIVALSFLRIKGGCFVTAFVSDRDGDVNLLFDGQFDGSGPMGKWGVALAYFMSETLVTDTTEASIPRPFRRRAEKQGLPCSVKVVKLRRVERESAEVNQDDSQSGNFSHRWFVNGHWRNQPCGPGRQSRKLTWVHPHIKGPEDKPLVPKDVVYSVVR